MKLLPLLLAGVALILTPVSPLRADDDLQALYQQGRAAFFAGQFDVAREKLARVLAKNPNHLESRAMMAQIVQEMGADNTSVRKSYEKVILPKFEVADVELNEALKAVRMLARTASHGTVTPNIILRNPEIGKKTVTLSLTNIPLSEVLNYLAALVGVQLTYDKNGVLLTNPAS